MVMGAIRRSELGSGWRIVLATAAGNAFGLGALPIYSLSSLSVPLAQGMGWSPIAIGLAATVLTSGIFLTGPIAGWLCDRFGVRRVALPSIGLFALTWLILAGMSPSLNLFYALYALLAVAGAGTTSIAYSRTVTVAFDRQRGAALGLMMSGGAITATLVPLALGYVTANADWRAGFLLCALFSLIPLPLVWFFLHDPQPGHRALNTPLPGLSYKAIVSGFRFWFIIMAALLVAIAMGMVIVHLPTMLGELGIKVPGRSHYVAMMGVGMIGGRICAGILLDYVRFSTLAILLFLAPATGFVLLALGNVETLWAAVLLVGLGLGAEGDILAFAVGRYLGMRNYAAAFGWVYGALAAGSAASPVLVLILREQLSFSTMATVCALFCAMSGLLLASLGRYPEWK